MNSIRIHKERFHKTHATGPLSIYRPAPSVLFRQQRRRGRSFAVPVGGFSDGPDLQVGRQDVGRQNSRRIMQSFIVQTLAVVRRIAPVFSNVSFIEIDDVDVGFPQCLKNNCSGQKFADQKIWLADFGPRANTGAVFARSSRPDCFAPST